MSKVSERVVVGIIFIIAGLFLILNQFTFKIAFFPWILLVIGTVIFLTSLFSGNFWGGLQALIWLGGLAFAFYFDQLFPGILIILGFSIIAQSIRSNFKKSTNIDIEIKQEDNN